MIELLFNFLVTDGAVALCPGRNLGGEGKVLLIFFCRICEFFASGVQVRMSLLITVCCRTPEDVTVHFKKQRK